MTRGKISDFEDVWWECELELLSLHSVKCCVHVLLEEGDGILSLQLELFGTPISNMTNMSQLLWCFFLLSGILQSTELSSTE